MDSLIISHCTIVPRKNKSIGVDGINSNLVIILDNTICGRIDTSNSHASLKIKNSIVDGSKILTYDTDSKKVKYDEITEDNAVQCFRISEITNGPVFGKVNASIMDLASNSIFTGKIKIKRLQTGCMRFCYIPEESIVPNMFKCQPDSTINNNGNNIQQQQQQQ